MTVRDLHRRLDEVIGRQERTLSQISVMSQGGPPQHPPQGHGQGMVSHFMKGIKEHFRCYFGWVS